MLHYFLSAIAQHGLVRRYLVLAFVTGLMLPCWLPVTSVSAATYTWTNTGSNGNWGDIFKWAGFLAPPTNGVNTDIVLRGSDTSPDIQNIANSNVNYDIDSIILSVQYSGGGTMFLTGGELTVDNEIANFDSHELEFNSVVHMGDQFLNIKASNGNLDFNAAVQVALAGSILSVSGGESVFFDGGLLHPGAFFDTTLNITGDTFVRLGGSSTSLGLINIIDGTLQMNTNLSTGPFVDVNVSAGSTYDLNNFDMDINRLVGSGSVDLGTARLTLGDSTNSFFSGSISGSGRLTHNAPGTMTLAGNNTYTGATSITNGTIKLSGSGRLSNSTDVSVSSGATFDLNGVSDTVDSISGSGTIRLGGGVLTVDETSGTRTFFGKILESGELQKNGNGTLVLFGTSNTYTLLDINAGTVQVYSQGSLGSGSVELGSGTLQISQTFSNTRPILTNSLAATVRVDESEALIQNGVISGTGGIIKQGIGTLVLGAGNTYTGDTQVLEGVVRLGGPNRISDSSNVKMIAGTVLELQGFTETVNSLSGTGGEVHATGSSRLTVGASNGTFTWGGVISGTGGFTKAGNHTMIVTASQTNSGTTNIEDGLLRLATSSGGLSIQSDILIEAGATWDLNGQFNLVHSINGSGSILLGGGTLVVVEGGLNFTNSTRTFSGVINGPGDFVKDGNHVLILTGNNTYTGTTTLANTRSFNLVRGSLQVASSSNLGAGSLIFENGVLNTTGTFTNNRAVTMVANDSAIFDVDPSTTLTQSGPISGSILTKLVKEGAGTFRTTNPNGGIFFGDIDIRAGTFDLAGGGDGLSNLTTVKVNNPGIFLVNNPDDIGGLTGNGRVFLNEILRVGHDNESTTFSGSISGVGLFGKRGTGTLTLSGIHFYTGITDIDGGVLQLSGAGQLSNLTDVDIAAGAIFDLNDASDLLGAVTIGALSGSGSVTMGDGASHTFKVGASNSNGTFSGDITETGSFAKVGTGTQTLSGTNTWTGETQINYGKLRVSHTVTNLGDGPIQMNGGTLEITSTHVTTKNVVINSGGGTIDVDPNQTLTMLGSGIFTGIGSLTKTDSGSLRLTGNNTYTGDTIINAGTLIASGSNNLSDLTDVFIASGATWDLAGNQDTVKSIAGDGSIILAPSNTTGTLTVNQDGGSTTFDGSFSGRGTLIKEGTHLLTLTGTSSINGGFLVNRGEVVLSGGGSISQESLSIGSGFGSNGTTTVDGASTAWNLSKDLIVGFNGDGQMNINNGATVTVERDVKIGGNGFVATGIIRLDGGTLDNSAGNGIIVARGTLQGQGTIIGNVFNNDTVAPGNSAGLLTLTGDYDQDATGTLSLEIGGADNSDPLNPEFDLLDISGTADLGGQLELALIDGFAPDPADTFTILSSSALTGMFSNVADGDRLGFASGSTGTFQVDYTTNSVVLSNFLATLFTADFDIDGDVDGEDLTDPVNGWQARYGVDLNGGNFLDWQRQFGSGVPLLASSQTVPEPNTVVLLLLGFLGLLVPRQLGFRFFFRSTFAVVTRH